MSFYKEARADTKRKLRELTKQKWYASAEEKEKYRMKRAGIQTGVVFGILCKNHNLIYDYGF